MNNQLLQLYEEPDNLRQFKHPVYKRKFRFLTNKKVLNLAKKTSKKIINSKYDQIVVIESGSRPFAEICKKLIANKKNLNWAHLKFPRDPTKNIAPILLNFMSKNESISKLNKIQKDELETYFEQIGKQEVFNKIKDRSKREIIIEVSRLIPFSAIEPRKKSLEEIILNFNNKKNIYQNITSTIFQETDISKILSKEFILFEDYITSGHTLSLVINYLKFLSKRLNFKIVCYFFNLKNPEQYEIFLFSLFDKETKLKGYSYGAYPFENRIDLIGYFYCISNEDYKKIFIKKLINKNTPNTEFLNYLNNLIKTNDLTNKVKNSFKNEDVKKFINKDHLTRYYLYLLEKELKIDNYTTEFLWLSQDMYGPLWCPLPIEYHFEFMGVFGKIEKEFKDIKEFKTLLKEYRKNRKGIISEIARIFLDRGDKWLNSINKLIRQHGN